MLVLICGVCGKEFMDHPSNKRRFCSRRCGVLGKKPKSHGMSKTRLHNIWCGMKNRCNSTKGERFAYYKALGIAVCEAWTAFEPFKNWALANGYAEGLEIDRKDNTKGYSPDNCRWATRNEQMANQGKRRAARTSRFKGVSWCANVGKWRTQIQQNGTHRHVGLFENEEDAARAYDAEAKRLFGEFASPNFKEEGAHC